MAVFTVITADDAPSDTFVYLTATLFDEYKEEAVFEVAIEGGEGGSKEAWMECAALLTEYARGVMGSEYSITRVLVNELPVKDI